MAELGPISANITKINQTEGTSVADKLPDWVPDWLQNGVSKIEDLMGEAQDAIIGSGSNENTTAPTETPSNSTATTNVTPITNATTSAGPASTDEMETPSASPEASGSEDGSGRPDNVLEYSELELELDESIFASRYESKVDENEDEGQACKEQLINSDTPETNAVTASITATGMEDGTNNRPAPISKDSYSDDKAWKLINQEYAESECAIQILAEEQLGVFEQLGRAYYRQIFDELRKGGMLPIAEGLPVGDMVPVLQAIENARVTLENRLEDPDTTEGERSKIESAWAIIDGAINDILSDGPTDVKLRSDEIAAALASVDIPTDAIASWQAYVLDEAKLKLYLMDYGSADLPGLYWGQLISNKALELPGGNRPLGIDQILRLERAEQKRLPELLAEQGIFPGDDMLATYYYRPIQTFFAVPSNASYYLALMGEAKYSELEALFQPANINKPVQWPAAPKEEDHPDAVPRNLHGLVISKDGEEEKDLNGKILTDDDLADVDANKLDEYLKSELEKMVRN